MRVLFDLWRLFCVTILIVTIMSAIVSVSQERSDFTQDGLVDRQDLLQMIELWDEQNPAADVNSDGRLNASDIFIFGSNWRQALFNRPPKLESIPNQVVEAGSSITFPVVASDPDQDLLSFSTDPLPLPRNFSFDADRQTFTFAPGPDQAGEILIRLIVSDGLLSAETMFQVTVPTVLIDAETGIAGRILDSDTLRPLENVRVQVGGIEGFTNALGEYELLGIESGEVPITIDGSQVEDGLYPTLIENISLLPNVMNRITRPIFIPQLDIASADPVVPGSTSVISSTDVIIGGENFGPIEVIIPPNTARERGSFNSYQGDMSITVVEPSRAPLPLPDGIVPFLYYAFQPPTVEFDPPVVVSFPNVDGYSPGAFVDIFGLNQDTGNFEKIGTGTVTEDGANIVSDGGVIRSGSWHAAAPPTILIDAEGNVSEVDDPEWQARQSGSSSVGLQNGSLRIDFELPHILSLSEEKRPAFFYNSHTANPRPVLDFNVSNPSNGPVPEFIVSRVNVGGVKQPDLYTQGGADMLPFGTTDPFRQAYQFDAVEFPTGFYDYEFRVACLFPSAQRVSDPVAGTLVLRNDIQSPFGAGWSFSELRRLRHQEDGRVTISVGDGSIFGFNPVFKGTGEFLGSENIPLNAAMNEAKTADVNGDGIDDLFIAGVSNFQADQVNVFLSQEDGTFADVQPYRVNAGSIDFELADIDKDDVLDLVVMGVHLEWLRGLGDGTFEESVRLLDQTNARGLTIADLDGDENPDIAYPVRNNDTVTVLFGDGGGSFLQNPIMFGVGDNPEDIESADFNGDGIVDLVVANKGSRDITVLFNDGTGTFLTTDLIDVGGLAEDILVADLNEDGNVDIAVANATTFTVDIVWSMGDGEFSGITSIEAKNSPRDLDIADYNGDGVMDISAAHIASRNVAVWLGDGEGNFIESDTLNGSEFPEKLVSSDLDGDQLPELIIADPRARSITIYRNLGDGLFIDTPSFQANSGTGFPLVADFNNDNHLDVITLDGNTTNSTLLFGDGQGGFGQPFPLGGTGGFGAPQSVAADFNNDGVLDWARPSGGDSVNVFLGNNLGVFNRFGDSVQTGFGNSAITSADFNLDGNIDLASVNTNSDNVSALLGDGTGAFPTRFDIAVGSRPIGIVNGDFDDDGFPDLAVMSSTGARQTHVLFGRGNGTFLEIVSIPVGQRNPFFLVKGDFNGDSALDLAQVNKDDDTVSVMYGDGLRGFSDAFHVLVDADPVGLQAGDMNDDGLDDLIVSSQTHENVLILLSQANGDFIIASRYSMGDSVDRIGKGDFDEDGVLDFVVANGNTVSVLLGVQGELSSLDNSMVPEDQLALNEDGSFTHIDRFGMRFEYDETGLLTAAMLNESVGITYAYDAEQRVETITYPTNQDYSFSYQNGKLRTLTDPAGRVTVFEIDEQNNLTSITGPDGAGNQYAYDEFHRMTSLTTPNDKLYQYSYTENGLLEQIALPNDEIRQVAPSNRLSVPKSGRVDAQSALPVVMTKDVNDVFTTGAGTQVSYKTDPVGAAEEIVDERGFIFQFDHNEQGSLTQSLLPNGAEYRYRYNTSGNLVSIVDDDGGVSLFDYDENGNLVKLTTPGGRVVRIAYNDANVPVAYSSGDIGSVTNEYDERGMLAAQTNALDQVQLYEYDENGNIVKYTDPEGHAVPFQLDSAGNILAATNVNGDTVFFEYDLMNRPVVMINERGETVRFEYDNMGNTTKILDHEGAAIEMEYDPMNAVIAMVDQLGARKEFVNNELQLRESLTTRNGETVRFEYNESRDMTGVVLQNGDRQTFEYNSIGAMTTMSDADSQANFDYDSMGRLLGVRYGSEDAQILEPAAETAFEYDRDDMLIRYTDPSGMDTHFTYDSRPVIRSMTTNLLRLDFDIDAGERLVGLHAVSADNVTAELQRDLNLANIVTAITNSVSGTVISSFAYELNPIGEVARMVDHNGDEHSYEYDETSQLVSARHSGVMEDEFYTYDMRGNRIASHLDPGPILYDAANRVLEDSRFTYEHDAEGNLTRKINKSNAAATVYTYDALNKLIAVETIGANGLTEGVSVYTYNPAGQRTSKTVNGVTTKYLWNTRNQLIAEYDGEDQLLATYTYGPGLQTLLSVKRGDSQFIYHRDHLHSVIQITDAAGVVVNEYQYDSFGRVISAREGIPNPFLYTGAQYDPETGLYYMKKRYYDPQLGRFLQEDPMFNLSGYNFYRYVKNNPMNRTDPEGTFLVGGVAGLGVNLIGQGVKYATDDKKNQGFLSSVCWGSLVFDTVLGAATCGAGTAVSAARHAKHAEAVRKGIFATNRFAAPSTSRVARAGNRFFNSTRGGRFARNVLTNPAGNAAVGSFGKDLLTRGTIDANTLRDFIMNGAMNKLGNGVSRDFNDVSADILANSGLAAAEALKNWNGDGSIVNFEGGLTLIKF